jgi:hypothetical protein
MAWVAGGAAALATAGTPHLAGGMLQPLLASGHATVDFRHTVALDLRNAPAGVTNDGVAAILQPVLDQDAYWSRKMDAAMAASGTRWVG